MVSVQRLVFNALTFIPGVLAIPGVRGVLRRRSLGTGGTSSARYCYSVWLRHLQLAARAGVNTQPAVVAELGPGDSVGIGLAALLSGAERYLAFDLVAHANAERNLQVFEELIALFQARAAVPDGAEFPELKPALDDYAFPAALLGEARLRAALAPERLQRIRAALAGGGGAEAMVQYRAPWLDDQLVEPASVDMVFSQAVLEHADDLETVYRVMARWLKPEGFMSHQIDFTCHGSARDWNGHWAHSELMWQLIRGKDVWLINREPLSTHLQHLERGRFRILGQQLAHSHSRITLADVAPRFRQRLSAEDLITCGTYIVAAR